MPCSCSATTSRSARLRAASAREDREGTEEAPGTVYTGTGEDPVALRSCNLSGMHVGSMWRWSLRRGIEGREGKHPSLGECREAAAVLSPSLHTEGSLRPLQRPFFSGCVDTLVWQQSVVSRCAACATVLSLCSEPRAVGVGSLGHRAQSPRAATLLQALPFQLSRPLARALLSQVPVATFPVYFLLAPLPVCRRQSSAEDLAAAAAPGSSLRSPCATLAPSPSCPFCEAVQFSCRSLRLIPRMG